MARSVSETPPAPAKAYSYLRFSTPEQEQGDSLRRQTSLAAEYAARNGLELDLELTFEDRGVSAHRSANLSVGRLGDFMEAVRAGQVPEGSFLLVESLDRISRDHAYKAQHLLSSIIMEGVSVVTLLDERVYSMATLQADPLAMMYSILGFMRANEESVTKSRRLKEVWSDKRAKLGTAILTSKAPAWLQLNREAACFEPIPERAAVVQRIYAMTLDGVGQHKIAETLNREGLPPWGRGRFWQRSYVAKVLSNPAVIGTLTPHLMEHVGGKKVRKALEPVEGYYPAVIAPETFADVQALQLAGSATRGRHAHAPLNNILAGLAACPLCFSTMTRVHKGSKSRPAFACVAAKNGAGCTPYKTVPYHWIEDRLLLALPQIIEEQEGVALPEDLDREIDEAEYAVSVLHDQARSLLDNLSYGPSPSLAAELRAKETELEDSRAVYRRLLERREAVSGLVIGARTKRALAALQAPVGGEIDRAEANRALRSIFKRAVINWPELAIDLEWTQGGTCRIIYTLPARTVDP